MQRLFTLTLLAAVAFAGKGDKQGKGKKDKANKKVKDAEVDFEVDTEFLNWAA